MWMGSYFHVLKSIYVFFMYHMSPYDNGRWVIVQVDTNHSIARVDQKFISVAIDSGMAAVHWEGFNFSSYRLKTLAMGLTPAYLRLGGSSADWMVFDDVHTRVDWNLLCKCFSVTGTCTMTMPNIPLTTKYWDLFNTFALDSNMEVLLDLNLLLRDHHTCGVNLTNTRHILEYSHQRGFSKNIHFELGNEPDLYPGGFRFTINGKQDGKDVTQLKSLLTTPPFSEWYSHSLLVGPDTAMPASSSYIKNYVNSGGQSINYVTYHHYNVHAETSSVKDFVNPDIYDAYAKFAASIRQTVQTTKYPSLPIWLGESNTGWGAGKRGLTDTYVNGLMWLDKLGVAAMMDTKVVVRQTFYGYNYSLVDHSSNPLPDYWLMLLHKRLVGQQVLSAKTNLVGDKAKWVRVYSHCTPSSRSYKKGSITFFVINLHSTAINLWLGGVIMSHHNIDEYLMTPGDGNLLSRDVYLNGIKLEMISDTVLPPLQGRRLSPLSAAIIPAHTYAFYVVPEADVKVCMI